MPKNQLRRIIDTKRIPAVSIMTVGIPVEGGVAPPPTGMVPVGRTIAGTSPIRINGGNSATLAGNITVSVLLASNGGVVNSGGLAVQLASNSGLEYVGGIRAKVPTASGILRNANGLQLAPADITVDSSNTLVNHTHSHNIVTSAAPTNDQILQSNDTGGLALTRLNTPVVGTAAGALQLTALTDVNIEPVQEVNLNPGTHVLLSDGKSIKTIGFASGFNGAGAAWEHVHTITPPVNKTVFTVDDLWVRGTMHVYELLIHQIRATNGSIFVSSTGKASAVSGTTTFTVTTDPEHGFLPNDIIRAQRWNGGAPYQSTLRVVTVVNTYVFTAVILGGVAPQAGYEYVRLGNTTNTDRQGGIYMTADDANAPYMDVFDGVSSLALWNTPNVIKMRIGNLAGSYNYPSTPKVYGFATGKSAQAHMTVEDINGLRIKYNTSTRLQIDLNGSLLLFAGDEDDPTKAVIALMNTGQAYFANRLLIGEDGEIRQGTIWNGTTYVTDDGRDFVNDAGVLAAQFNGTRFWQQGGVGRIGGYRRGVKQWDADNEGMITAGGGAVQLQHRGLTFYQKEDVLPTADLIILDQNSVSWYADPYSTTQRAIANLVAGVTTQDINFVSLNIDTADHRTASIMLSAFGNNTGLWFSGFRFITGIPGALFNQPSEGGPSTARFGEDGRGDWFIISENTTTRVGGHWVPSINLDKFLGTPELRWARVYTYDFSSTGTAYFNNITITGTMVGGADMQYASVAVDGDIVVAGTVDGVKVSTLESDYIAHKTDTNIHHNKSHSLLSVVDHFIEGQTIGDVLTVTGPTTWDFQPISAIMLGALSVADTASVNMTYSAGVISAVVIPSGISHNSLSGRGANDHHNQQHALDGTDHTGVLSWTKVSKVGSNLTDIAVRSHSDLSNINANDHHNQQHSFDSTDHTGTLSWAKVNKVGSNLTDIATRAHGSLTGIGANDHHPQVHALVSSNHTATGLTIGHFLRAITDTTFAFAEISLEDLPAAGGNYKMLRSDGSGATVWEDIGTLAGDGIAHTSGVLSVAPGTMISINPDSIQIADGALYQFIGTGGGTDAAWFDVSTLAGNGLFTVEATLNVVGSAMITVNPDTVQVTDGVPYQFIGTGDDNTAGWIDVSVLAGDSLTSNLGQLFVNLDHNFAWTGTHQFADTVQVQATMTTRSMFPEETDTYNIGSPLLLYNQSFISQMNAVLYAENTAQLIGGWFIIPKYAGKMGAVSGDGEYTTVDLGIGDVGVIQVADYIVVRAHDVNGDVKTEYMQVVGYSGGTSWLLTRDMMNPPIDPNPVWAAGTPYMLLGNNGDGRIELNAHDTPRISVVTQGFSATSQYEYVRLGDLNENWGYGAQTWGFAAGRYGVSAHTWITVDPTNGIRLGNNTDIIGQWDSTGKIIIGKVANNKPRIEIDDVEGFRILHRDGTATDNTLIQLSVTGNATLTGVLGIGLGGGIYQGSGDFLTPTTGLKIWNNDGIGNLATYRDGIAQVSIDSEGALLAGSGSVRLDAGGLSIQSGSTFSATHAITFNAHPVYGGNTLFGIYTTYVSGIVNTEAHLRAHVNSLLINDTGTTRIGVYAYSSRNQLSPGRIELRTFTVKDYNADVTLNNATSIVMMTTTITITATTLALYGAVTMYSGMNTTRVQVDGGSVSLPSLGWYAFPNTGFWFSTGQVNVSVLGINRAAISATGLNVAGVVSGNTMSVTASSWGGGYRFSSGDWGIISTANYIMIENNGAPIMTSRTDAVDSYLRLGFGNTNSRNAYIDFFADGASPTLYNARVIRNAGVNGTLIIANEGTGNLSLQTNGVSALYADSNGNIVARGTYLAGNSSLNVPAFRFSVDTNSGINMAVVGEVQTVVNGVAVMTVESTGITMLSNSSMIGLGRIFNLINVAAGATYNLGTMNCFVFITSVGGSINTSGLFHCRNNAVVAISSAGITIDNTGSYSVYFDSPNYVFINKTAGAVSIGITYIARG